MPVERLRNSRPIKPVPPYQKAAGAVRITQSKKRLSAYRTYDTFYILKRLIKSAKAVTHYTNSKDAPHKPADKMEWEATPVVSESMDTHTTVLPADTASDNEDNKTESV